MLQSRAERHLYHEGDRVYAVDLCFKVMTRGLVYSLDQATGFLHAILWPSDYRSYFNGEKTWRKHLPIRPTPKPALSGGTGGDPSRSQKGICCEQNGEAIFRCISPLREARHPGMDLKCQKAGDTCKADRGNRHSGCQKYPRQPRAAVKSMKNTSGMGTWSCR
jgi:hypothetical protein